MAMLPLQLPGDKSMPMAQTTALPLDLSSLIPGSPQSAPTPAAPPAAAGLATAPAAPPMPGGAPASMPAFPPPGAPMKPPYEVVMQADGSSVYQVPPPMPGMPPVVIAVNKAPKVPPALQPPTPTSLAAA